MNQSKVSQIVFSATYTVPPEQTTHQMFRVLPHASGSSDRMPDAMATGYLVAVLESMCAQEMQPHIDPVEQTVFGFSAQCQFRAPIPPGALVHVDGQVICLSEDEVTFWVRAIDEQEIVCDGQISLRVVGRAVMATKIRRKCEAIQRRQLFATA